MTAIKVHQGHGGWERVELPGLRLPGVLYVRTQRSDDGQHHITEVYLDGRGRSIPADEFRRIPLSRVEAVIQSEFDEWAAVAGVDDDDVPPEWRYEIAWDAGPPGPDLSRLAAHYAHRAAETSGWVADSLAAQTNGSGVEQVAFPPEADAPKRPTRMPKLRRPKEGLTDDFLRQVASAFRIAVSLGKPPAQAIRAASVKPISYATAKSWIGLAREREFLEAPPHKGRIV